MTTDLLALVARMADELEAVPQHLLDDRSAAHSVAAEARAVLAESERIDPEREKAAACIEDQLLPWLDRDAAIHRAELAQQPRIISRDRDETGPYVVVAEPEPPAEGKVPTLMEIVELADEIEAKGLGQVDLVRAALARWGSPTR